MNSSAGVAFIAFGLCSQAVLVAYFAARRWRPALAERDGWLAYAFAGLGLPLAIWLLAAHQSWRLWTGPLLLGLWAAFGVAVDRWRPVEWRSPIRWGIFVPYLAMYFWAQMFLWWPLWDLQPAAWTVFLVLFATNTVLNLSRHPRPWRGAQRSASPQ
ncbi:MAG: hypothetical protein R2686_08380 [Candidatus Nanopelagicales bacterium]